MLVRRSDICGSSTGCPVLLVYCSSDIEFAGVLTFGGIGLAICLSRRGGHSLCLFLLSLQRLFGGLRGRRENRFLLLISLAFLRLRRNLLFDDFGSRDFRVPADLFVVFLGFHHICYTTRSLDRAQFGRRRLFVLFWDRLRNLGVDFGILRSLGLVKDPRGSDSRLLGRRFVHDVIIVLLGR